MKRAAVWSLAIAACLLAASFGYRRGTVAASTARSAPPKATAAATAGTSTPKPQSPHPAAALPRNLHTIDGKAFVDALPAIERRARAGDEYATRYLVERLQDCANYTPQSEEDIRESVDRRYERQLDVQSKMAEMSDERNLPDMPHIDEAWHQARLREALDQRERCAALDAREIGKRFDFAELALSRHDRTAVMHFAAPGWLAPNDLERLRYVDRLVRVSTLERNELDALVESGDQDAMREAARRYSAQGSGIVDADPARAYVVAWALSKAAAGPVSDEMTRLAAGLAAGPLLPAEVDSARAAGEALYLRCCASR